MRKYLFNGAIISAAVSAVSVINATRKGPRDWRLALIWVRAVPLPRILLPIVTAVASASLFVYLVHWELYPLLEDDAPLAATVLSFAAGMLVWAVWRRALRLPRLQRRLAARAGRSSSPSA